MGEFSAVLEQFTSKEGLSADYVTSILEDREGNVWVAINNGLDQFRLSDLAAIELGSAAGGLSLAPGEDGQHSKADGTMTVARVITFSPVTGRERSRRCSTCWFTKQVTISR